LTGRTNDDLELGVRNEESKERSKNSSLANASKMSSAKSIENKTKNHAYETQMTYANNITKITDQQQVEFPAKVKPMLSTLVDKPFDNKDWVFEIKWDGVRSILLFHKSKRILELQSRNSKSITHRYPELIKALSLSMPSSSSLIKCKESVVLDGEIVVLDKRLDRGKNNESSNFS
jgi:bifunctional non-homologous end joining protein LigD